MVDGQADAHKAIPIANLVSSLCSGELKIEEKKKGKRNLEKKQPQPTEFKKEKRKKQKKNYKNISLVIFVTKKECRK